MKTLGCGIVLIGAACLCAAEAPFVGVELRPLGADVAAYLGIEHGVLVGAVMEKSPAEAAGIKANDIILRWNGEAVAGPEAFIAKVKAAAPGEAVKLAVVRKGAEHELALAIGVRPGEAAPPAEAPSAPGYLGLAFEPAPPVVCEYLGLDEARSGVYVVQVLDDSPAAKAGLKERDLIRKVNGKDVAGPEEFQDEMHGFKSGQEIEIEGLRAGRELKVKAVLGERPAGLEKKLRRPTAPWHVPAPGKESAKDRFTLRFKDRAGKEHVVPFPALPPGGFEFEMPKIDWPDILNAEQVKELEARVREAMDQAAKRLDEHRKDLKGKHEAFLKKLEVHKGGAPSGGESKSVVVSKSVAQMTSSDGVHEITVKIENGKKTVTVKEGDKVIASDLPFEQIGTLPEEIQKKVKNLDGNVIIQAHGHTDAGSSAHEEKKEVELGVPAQRL